jgi:uncharacterized membrane protein
MKQLEDVVPLGDSNDLDMELPARGVSPGRRRSAVTKMVVLAALVQASVISALAIQQHHNFGSWGFDFALYDQAWWLVGQDGISSTSFMTVRGLPLWGHHINGVLLLLAPFARLGIGAEFLIVVQAFVLAAGAIPLSWLARTKTGSRRSGALFAALYLLYPAVGWLGWVSFHPEALAVTPILFAAWFAHSRRYARLAICVGLALICREEVGLVVGLLGFAWFLRAATVGHANRRRSDVVAGLLTLIAGLGWFVVCSRILIPAVLGSDAFYIDHFYAQYGNSMSEVALNLATHPTTMVSLASKPQARTYLLDLFGPLGFMPLLGLPLLGATPQLVAIIAADSEFVRDVRFQYTALLIPGLMLAAVDAYAWILRKLPKFGKSAFGWLMICSCLFAFFRGPLPGGVAFGSWKLREPNREALEHAVSVIPADASVAAADNITAHLSHRRAIYDFPNPFQWMVFGRSEADAASPDDVGWIIVEPDKLGEKHRAVYDGIVHSGRWQIVFNEGGVVVARDCSPKHNPDVCL